MMAMEFVAADAAVTGFAAFKMRGKMHNAWAELVASWVSKGDISGLELVYRCL